MAGRRSGAHQVPVTEDPPLQTGGGVSPMELIPSGWKDGTAVSDGTMIPIIYGKGRTTCFPIYSQTGDITHANLVYAVCAGPISSIDKVYINGIDVSRYLDADGSTPLVTFEYGNGAYDQVAGSYMSGQGYAYKLPGLAWVRIYISKRSNNPSWQYLFPDGINTVTCDVTGMIVKDMSGTPVYSTNAALVYKDFLTNTEHGMGLPESKIDTVSFTDAYNFYATADGTYPDGHKYTINYVINTEQPGESILAALRLASNSTVYEQDGVWKIYVDKVNATTAIDFDTATNISDVQFNSLSSVDFPSKVTLKFRNAAKDWKEDSISVEDPDLTLGLVDLREAVYTVDACTQEKQAHNIAVFLINQAKVSGRIQFTATPAAATLEVGEVFTVTETVAGVVIGLDHQKFVCTQITRQPSGFYSVSGKQYADAIFDTTVLTVDVPLDSGAVDPFATPPSITLDAADGTLLNNFSQKVIDAQGTYSRAALFTILNYTLPNYPYAKELHVRFYSANDAFTMSWDDLANHNFIVPLDGNLPLNRNNGHFQLVANDNGADNSGYVTYQIDPITGVTTSTTIDVYKCRMMVKLMNTVGVFSNAVTRDFNDSHIVIGGPDTSPPDIVPTAGPAIYDEVYYSSTGTQTINNAYAGSYYTIPAYAYGKELVVRCFVGAGYDTKTWADMANSERLIPLTGNAPLNPATGDYKLVADALSVGQSIYTFDGNTGALLNTEINYSPIRIMVKLRNMLGADSTGVTIDYLGLITSTPSNNSVADPTEIRQYGAAYPDVFRFWWSVPRVVESETHYGASYWTLTNCGNPNTARVNDGLTSLVAFDWNVAANSQCDIDLGSNSANWKKFFAVRFVMTSTTFTSVPNIYYSDNGSSWTSVVPTYWQPYWSGTNIIGYTFEWGTPGSTHRYWRFEKGSSSAINMSFTEIQWIATTGVVLADEAILNTLVYAKADRGIVTTADPLIMSWPGSAPRPTSTTPIDFSNWTFTPGDGNEYLNLMFVSQCVNGDSTGKQVFAGMTSRVGQGATTKAFGPVPASGNAGLYLDGTGKFSAPPAGTVTSVGGTAPVVSSGGTTPVISMAAATAAVNGYMTSAYASKLDGIAAGAQPGTVTSVGGSSPINSTGGNSPIITIDAATTLARGTMSAADKTKLDGIATGATANLGTVTDVTGTSPVVSSGGTTPAISMPAATSGNNGYMTSVYAAKIDGIAAGAQPGTVTAIGVTTANGVSGSSSGGTTPNLTITLGAITPSSIACSGAITATGNITAYYSDKRLKENIVPIKDALAKVVAIRGVTFNANAVAASLGYTDKKEQVGVIAQEVQAVLPHVVVDAPIGHGYLTVQYDRLVPLLIEAIKELKAEVDELRAR